MPASYMFWFISGLDKLTYHVNNSGAKTYTWSISLQRIGWEVSLVYTTLKYIGNVVDLCIRYNRLGKLKSDICAINVARRGIFSKMKTFKCYVSWLQERRKIISGVIWNVWDSLRRAGMKQAIIPGAHDKVFILKDIILYCATTSKIETFHLSRDVELVDFEKKYNT